MTSTGECDIQEPVQQVIFVLLSQFVFGIAHGEGVNSEKDFLNKTSHLAFSAPKSCNIEVTTEGKATKSAFELVGNGCRLKEPKIETGLAKKTFVFICSMLVPALNTEGQSLIGDCQSNAKENDKLIFVGCGKSKRFKAELNLKKLTVKAGPADSPNEYLINSYSLVGDKLFPSMVEFKSANADQQITKIEYKDNFPLRIEGKASISKFTIGFSDCISNH